MPNARRRAAWSHGHEGTARPATRGRAPQQCGDRRRQKAADQAAQDSGDELAARVQVLEEQLAAAQDQSLRVAADLQNVRRRAEQDVEKAHKFALEKFAGDLLPKPTTDQLVATGFGPAPVASSANPAAWHREIFRCSSKPAQSLPN